MILSRLMKAVREQNWFAVALEFVIVILGVVIGFQVTSWNEERTERETEQIYLTRLHRDMQLSVCRIQRERDNVAEWNTLAQATLDALLLRDPDAVTDSGFELVASTRVQTGSPFRATLNELINGGRANIISNEILRAQIAETDAELTSYDEYIQILVNAQGTFLNQVHSRLRPSPGSVYRISYDFEALADDDQFINSLGHSLRITDANRVWLGRMVEVTDTLRVAVGTELGVEVPVELDCDTIEGATS